MAVSAVTLYSKALLNIGQGKMNLSTDTFVAVLLSSSYSPAVNVDGLWSDISANEVTGTGYTAGGVALSSQSWASASGTATFTAGNASWSSATITAQYAAVVRRSGGSLAGTDMLVGYVNLNVGGSPVSSTAGTFSVTWNASGIFTLTHTP